MRQNRSVARLPFIVHAGLGGGQFREPEIGIAAAVAKNQAKKAERANHAGRNPHGMGTRSLIPAPRPGRDSTVISALIERARRFRLAGPRRRSSNSSKV